MKIVICQIFLLTGEDTKDLNSKTGFTENERGKQISDFFKNSFLQQIYCY